MNPQKTFGSVPFLIITFIVLLTFSLWYWINESLKQDYRVIDEQISVATTTDETADWKTYRNEEYGFEFKYPNAWSNFSEIPISLLTNQGKPTSGFEVAFASTKGPSIKFWPANASLTYDSYMVQELNKNSAIVKDFSNIETATRLVILVRDSELNGRGEVDHHRKYFLLAQNGSEGFISIGISFPKDSTLESRVKEFNQFISTFKFTN